MRKTVTFDRPVHFMIPVWHQQASNNTRNPTKYNRPMVIFEISANKAYQCDELQSLLNRGAVIPDEYHTYVCSFGFVPIVNGVPVPVSTVSTGLDPDEELN